MKLYINVIIILIAAALLVYLNFSPTLYQFRGIVTGRGISMGGGTSFGFPLIVYESICSDMVGLDGQIHCETLPFNAVGFIIDLVIWTLVIFVLFILNKKVFKYSRL